MKRVDERAAAEMLRQADNILILTHRNPDGDTLGSAFGLMRALRMLGKQAFVDCSDEIHSKYAYMWQNSDAVYNAAQSKAFSPDFVVAVDVADARLLGNAYMEKFKDIPLCIDHHASNTQYAESLYLKECSATCEMIYRVIQALGITPDREIADCLYTGIATDTGCFRYSSVTPETHLIAAELLRCGARADEINRIMFETKTRSYLRLEELVLNSLELYFGGKCALITITQEMFRQSGSNEGECDGIASLPRKIEGVLVGATLRERSDGTFKVSLRTYAPINAAKLCGEMGGGGHARAAGCDLEASYAEGKRRLLEIIQTELESL